MQCVWCYLRLVVLVLSLQVLLQPCCHAAGVEHHCGQRPFQFNMTRSPPAALSDAAFTHPWVQHNVAITYNPFITQDGLGSQVHRLLGVYAVAACSGLQYIPTAGLQLLAHLNATNMDGPSEAQQMAHRLNVMLGTPSTPKPINSSWRVVHLGRDCRFTWDTLLNETRAALAQQQPTLFNVSFTYGFALAYPAMMQCVPAFRPQPPACGWPLLRPIRVAVHIRAGDAEGDAHRLLPHSYYFNVTRAITKNLRRMQRDYVVEVYTQAAFGIRHYENGTHQRISGQQYVHDLHHNLGHHMVLLADLDIAWTFSQMVTADIFVHSKSTLSIAAGVLNTEGINIAPPKGSLPWPWLQAPHWLHPANASGLFDASVHQQLVSALYSKFGPGCRGRLFDGVKLAGQQRQAGSQH